MSKIIADLSPHGLTPLWKKSQLEPALRNNQLPDWVQQSYNAFVTIMRDDNFPCFFGTLAEQKEMLRYAIAPSLEEAKSFEHILEAVYFYLEEESNVVENSTEEDPLFLTLVIFFPLEAEEFPLDHYAEQAYTFLNELHQCDRFPWPDDISTDSSNSNWRYCLGGRSLFVNVCTPANKNRRSRNLGPGLTMVINPEDLFERAWKRWGEGPRRTIYQKVGKYDAIPPHPMTMPWKPEEERDHLHATVTVLADRNDRECVFPFRYFSSEQKQGKCPFH